MLGSQHFAKKSMPQLCHRVLHSVEIQWIAFRVQRSVQVFPLTPDFNVSFIHARGIIRGIEKGTNALVEFWRVILHP